MSIQWCCKQPNKQYSLTCISSFSSNCSLRCQRHCFFISLFLEAGWYRNNSASTGSVLSENAEVWLYKHRQVSMLLLFKDSLMMLWSYDLHIDGRVRVYGDGGRSLSLLSLSSGSSSLSLMHLQHRDGCISKSNASLFHVPFINTDGILLLWYLSVVDISPHDFHL